MLRKVDPQLLEGLAPDPSHAWRHDNIGRLLIFAFHFFEERLLERFQTGEYQDFRYIYFHLFRNIDFAGTRIVDLAKRAGVTKAAMGQLAQACERLGYVKIVADPTDGRAKIVTVTPSGRKVLRVLGRLMLQLEAEFRQVLGPARYKTLRANLLHFRSRVSMRPGT